MKSLLLVAVFSFTAFFCQAQFTYKIKADSVLITNDSCHAELNLENSTRDTLGFLYNKGKGRTEFRRGVIRINDTTFVIGGDTLHIVRGSLTTLPISSLTAATAANTINNIGYQQEWRWNSLAAATGLKLTSTSTAANANVQTLFSSELSGANSNSNQGTIAALFSNSHTGTGSSNAAIYARAMNGDNNTAIYGEAYGGSGNNVVAQFVGAAGSPIISIIQPTNTSHAGISYSISGLASWSTGMKSGGEFAFNNSLFFSGADVLRLSHSTGNVGVYLGSSPTARVNIGAGTATANTAPLKFTSGVNLTTPESGAVEFDGTNYFATSSTTRYTLAKTLTATATLNFGSTSAQNSADLTITVTGAADGDAVSLGVPNAAVNANSSYSAWVSASNTVTVRFCNYSSGSIDPASATFRVSVIKY